MIDIQNHIRNEGMLNLFDRAARGDRVTRNRDGGFTVEFDQVALQPVWRANRHVWSDYGETCVQCGLTRQDAFDTGVPYSCLRTFRDTAQDRNVFRPGGEADC